MSRKKAAGLDVNGWRDHVARNWSTVPGEEERVEGVHVASTGPLTSVVRIGDERTGRWIGGFPADIAPHGLGGGWGEVGIKIRRLPVRDLIEGRAGDPQHLAAAYTGLARGATHTVLAIEDSPDTTETVQERLLAGMSEARMRNSALVWRTVLAALYAIDSELIRNECSVGILSHTSTGISVQRLRIRRAGALRDVLAPERRNTAMMLEGPHGLRGLVERARRHAIGEAADNARTEHLATSKSVGRLALGLPHEREIVRLQNGDWQEITLHEMDEFSFADLKNNLHSLKDCDQVFLETVAEGNVRSRLEALIEGSEIGDIQALPPNAVAIGALVAAQRMSDGDPVYFDFLPRISTIVVARGEAQNFDLIDESETLEAGRVYRSPRPANLAIPKGFDEISIYLRKDAQPHPRKAVVTLDAALTKETPVSVWVEQKPAAGRARIVMEAPSLSRNFTVDWEKAEEDRRDWHDIIASLDAPPPAIPDRLVLKCGMQPWLDSPRASGMITLLEEVKTGQSVDWELLAQKAASRPFQEYCVSSDGDLPPNLTNDLARHLDVVTRRAMEIDRSRLTAPLDQALKDNATLKFLTWQFRRCPAEVNEWLTECIEDHAGTTGHHPFVWHPMNWTLIYQGVARTFKDAANEERVLRAVLQRGIDSWGYRAESACVSFMLSRSKTAPSLLTREDVEKIAQRAILEFQEAAGTSYTKFNYAPFLIGGLLRWRIKQPMALLTSRDPLADQLEKAIVDARNDLATRRNADDAFLNRREKYIPILDGLLGYLRGEGGNPNLLLDIYDA